MKTLIAIPCMETLETEFVKCLFRLKPVGDVKIEFLSGSLVYAGREKLVDKAIEEGFDYILWLDSDMIFEPDLMEKLFATGKDFVTGLYFTRKMPWLPVIFKKIDVTFGKQPTSEQYVDYPKEDVFEVDACGFGAVLMKTDVAIEVVKKFHTAFTPMLGAGEDIAFCLRCKELGIPMYCNSSVKLGHITRVVSNEASYLATRL